MNDDVRRTLTVGIFGPSDCDAETQRVEWVLLKDRAVNQIARRAHLTIQPVHWSQVTSGAGRVQDRINDLVDETDPPLRLFVFKDSFGSDAGLGLSGTEEELVLKQARN